MEFKQQVNDISLCTIYAKRKLHLKNLIRGLTHTSPFKELVIATMNDELPVLEGVDFPIKTAAINSDRNYLPLAAARNKCAEIATGEKIIFFDVDCIAHPDLIKIFARHLQQEDAIYQCSIRYLSPSWQQNNWTYNSLQNQSSFHPLQGNEIIDYQRTKHPYELFWSLCFGIRKKTFIDLGGFDDRFKGYGGEDTDFAFTARSQSVPLYKIGALAYHQFHPSYSPPLNHLAEIVRNALVFERKWHILPMKKWLDRFVEMGYIKLQDKNIKIIKYPTEAEMRACLK